MLPTEVQRKLSWKISERTIIAKLVRLVKIVKYHTTLIHRWVNNHILPFLILSKHTKSHIRYICVCFFFCLKNLYNIMTCTYKFQIAGTLSLYTVEQVPGLSDVCYSNHITMTSMNKQIGCTESVIENSYHNSS